MHANNSSFESLKRQLSNDAWFVTVQFLGKAGESIEMDQGLGDFFSLHSTVAASHISRWKYAKDRAERAQTQFTMLITRRGQARGGHT